VVVGALVQRQARQRNGAAEQDRRILPPAFTGTQPHCPSTGPHGRQHFGLYAIGLAILVVGLVFVGAPWTSLVLGLVILACPLMMMLMMGGMGHGSGDNIAEDMHDHRPTSGQL